MNTVFSFGIGIGTQNAQGNWLEIFYPKPLLNPQPALASALLAWADSPQQNTDLAPTPDQLSALQALLEANNERDLAQSVGSLATLQTGAQRGLVASVLVTDEAPSSVPSAYLKLHLLSHRLVKPHGTNLTGIFGALPNVAWTSEGAIDLAELPQRQLQARIEGRSLSVDCVDKFPKMTDYVVPPGVRIADTARVRLGAYIGKGSTVMHEGFVNFNAGTAGPNMIEGRVSAGVFVGAGSDLGGGCSTMGTLSGGGNIVISVGEKCLIGANAGIGIPLGNRCTVESGLYITAGTKVMLLDDKGNSAGEAKARELAGKADLLFRRNSLTGTIECLTNKSAVELNEALHAN